MGKGRRDLNSNNQEEKGDALGGFSLCIALLTVGIIFLLRFDDKPIEITSNILITISIIGFTVELSKLKSESNKYFSDISVGIFIGMILFWAWVYTDGFQNSALWLKFVIMFLFTLCFYGIYSGVFGLLYLVFQSKSRALNIDILIQLGGLIVAFLALFFTS